MTGPIDVWTWTNDPSAPPAATFQHGRGHVNHHRTRRRLLIPFILPLLQLLGGA